MKKTKKCGAFLKGTSIHYYERKASVWGLSAVMFLSAFPVMAENPWGGVKVTDSQVVNQTRTVTGTVVDDTGEPLIGVSIQVQGTTTGTVTDLDGNFSLSVPANATLVVSYIGYQTQNVKVGAQNQIKVTLKSDEQLLDEVVVIGYGTVKKKDLTGSVASVSAKDLIANPVSDVSQALQGKLAGVTVVSQDGRPGGEVSIKVRGGGSISQSNDPLFIVDGFPVSTISDIPADQIVSIDVLKDASSTAIYGSRGANGVILVTTKGADKDKVSISYNGFYQAKWTPKTTKAMGVQDYVRYLWGYGTALGLGKDVESYFGLGSNYAGGNHWDEYANMKAHDYTDDILSTASTWNQNLNISGGGEKTKFTFAANYVDDEGTKINSGYNRVSTNFKLNQILAKGLTFDMDVRFARTKVLGKDGTSTGAGSLLSNAFAFRPVDEPLGDGNENVFGMGSSNFDIQRNPVGQLEHLYNMDAKNNLRGNFALSWEIIKGLKIRSELGFGRGWNQTKYYEDYPISTDYCKYTDKYGKLTKKETKNIRSVTTINYEVQGLGESHNLSFLAGQEAMKNESSSNWISGRGFPSSDGWDMDRVFGMIHMGDASKYPGDNAYQNEIKTPESTLSFFGRANYSYKGKYLLTATFRADGSSKFGPNNRWGYFPAAAFGWRISDESFMSNAKDWLDNLKLRLSYGTAGADNIDSSLWRETWVSGTGVWNGNSVNTYKPSGLKSNPDLKWETTISRNVGLDFGIFNRLNGTLDVYWNTTKDLLMRQEIDSSTGYSYQYTNIGQTSNKGVELGLNYALIRSKDFNLNLSLTYNFNKNNIDELQDHQDIIYSSGWGGSSIMPGNDYLLSEGKSVGVIRGFKSDGFYSLDDFDYVNGVYKLKAGVPDISSNIFVNCPKPSELKLADGQVAFPGLMKLKNMNPEEDNIVNADDVDILGEVQAKHTGGFSFSGNYKNFDFNANFTYQIGGKVYNITSQYQLNGGKESGLGRNKMEWVKDCFQLYDVKNGDLVAITDPTELAALNAKAKYPVAYMEGSVVTSDYIEDASFLRLSNITLGYTLPKTWTRKVYMERARFYVTASNLFCLNGYSGLDPEVNANAKGVSSSTYYPTLGMDYGTYMRPRTFTVGVNIEF